MSSSVDLLSEKFKSIRSSTQLIVAEWFQRRWYQYHIISPPCMGGINLGSLHYQDNTFLFR